MSARSRKANRKKHADMPPLGRTINAWCAGYDISRSKYESMKRKGTGPRELRDEGIIRITAEADAEWRAAREEKSTTE